MTIALALSPIAFAEEQFGEAMTDAVPIRVAELTADPEAYVGQVVKVIGLVNDVCPKKGCWVEILDKQSSETIRLKVKDDVIVFPAEAKGDEITAEGIFVRMDLSPSETIDYLKHLAEERGEEFVKPEKPEALTIYQIKGKGAVTRKLAEHSTKDR